MESTHHTVDEIEVKERAITQIAAHMILYPSFYGTWNQIEFTPALSGEFRLLSQLSSPVNFGGVDMRGSGVLAGLGFVARYRQVLVAFSYDFFGWHSIHDPRVEPTAEASVRFASIRGIRLYGAYELSKNFHTFLGLHLTNFRSFQRGEVVRFLGEDALSQTSVEVGTSFVY